MGVASSAVEHSAFNRLVPGSNPGQPMLVEDRGKGYSRRRRLSKVSELGWTAFSLCPFPYSFSF